MENGTRKGGAKSNGQAVLFLASWLMFAAFASAASSPIPSCPQNQVCLFYGASVEKAQTGPSGSSFGISKFSCPANAPVTGAFASPYANINGETRKRPGIEIGIPEGTTVVAPAAGTVLDAGFDQAGAGNYILIRHASNPNVDTKIGYLQGPATKRGGESVKAGEPVGKSGKSGAASSPSVYFELDRAGIPQRDVEDICTAVAPTSTKTAAGPADTGACHLVQPVAGNYRALVISQVGQNRGTHIHAGDDVAVASGTSASAVCSGKVQFSGVEDPNGYGGEVVIRCACKLDGKDVFARYAHMKQRTVSTGQAVFQGQNVGLTGGGCNDLDHGNSCGAHLHFELRTRNEWGVAIEPKNYVNVG